MSDRRDGARPRTAPARPRTAGTRPRTAVLAVAAAGLFVSSTGSAGASASLSSGVATVAAFDSAALAATLAGRTTATDDGKPGVAVEDARALADTQTREKTLIRAARASAERRAVADRIAKAAKAKAAARAKAHRWVNPLAHPNLTSNFGYRWGRLHAGLDFGTPVGTPLRAMSTGTVVNAGPAQGYGLKVEIRYWNGVVSYYGHMSAIDARVGQKVTPGMVVGRSGNTGRSTGPHLHLEIHPAGGEAVDPKPWLRAHHLTI